MSTSNAGSRFRKPDNLTHDYAIPYAFNSTGIAVAVGDLCYFAGQVATYGDVAYPADQFTSLNNEALDQAAFASVFAGVSQQQILSTETNKGKRFVVRTEGVYEFKCPSQTWRHGDAVAIYSSGTALDPNQVDKPAASAGAIGWVARDYVNATTTVEVYLRATRAMDPIGGCVRYALGALTNDNITNTGSATAFATTATIPSQSLQAGDVLHVRAAAQVNAQNSTNTNQFQLQILTAPNTYTAVYNTGNLNLAANAIVLIDLDLFFTAVGASGAFYAVGDAAAGNLNSGSRVVQSLTNTAINTNEAITIRVTDLQSAASTGNVTQLLNLDVTNERR